MDIGLLFLAAYFFGSIPFGLILTRLAGHGDIRAIGSGNIGATNVLRTGNTKLAALVLFLDGLKGAFAIGLADMAEVVRDDFTRHYLLVAGCAALVGHVFPIWLKFRGGKGVATSLGVLLAWSWPVGLSTLAVWLVVAKVGRYSSLAALVALGLSPLAVIGFRGVERSDFLLMTIVIIALVYWKHAPNIRRLLSRTESQIGTKSN